MSKFLRVKCECGNEQTIFGSSANVVNCVACNKPVAEPEGGHTKVIAKILKVLS